MKKAVLYQPLEHDNVKCTACGWYCRIPPEKTGICKTRLNRRGKLYSLVYGKTTGPAVDPVEKKPLHHFLPGSQILSFGTAGCNFGCEFCQNSWMSQINKTQISPSEDKTQKPITGWEYAVEKINEVSVEMKPEKLVDLAVKSGCKGIAYTYNEPTVFIEYARDTARIAKKKGLANIFVSNGYQSPEAFEYISPYLDAINIDLKSIRDDFYRKICHARIGPVLENIRKFFGDGIITEVTTLVIPGVNDSDSELHKIAGFLADISLDIPWHLSAFHPDYKMQNTTVTSRESLVKAYEIGKKSGLHYVYTGNIRDDEHSATYCPGCGNLLIRRNNYQTAVEGIDCQTGQCRNCQERIYGVFS